jgi:N-sulfoglucosamine sulfohydrolase
MRPNILYLHTHDAGRYIEPYGHAVRTPNLMRLAREGIVFRNMHCAAPTCTPSRVAMLTGRAPHTLNVLGLAHRGWSLKRTDLHLATFLRESGYTTTLTGTQHEHTDPSALGYERILAPSWKSTKHRPATTEEAAASFIQENHERPFFLSVGFNTTHRTFPSPLPADDERYCRPPDPLPDSAKKHWSSARPITGSHFR